MKTLALRAHEKGLELACHVAADVPDALVGDPGRLRQVLVNLVGNAIKFTEQGEVVLRVEVRVADRARRCCLHFAVRDTGIGIAPEQQQERSSRRSRRPTARPPASTAAPGLGLAISARLVELMGGQIWVESEVGRGSTFHFTAAASAWPGTGGAADAGRSPVACTACRSWSWTTTPPTAASSRRCSTNWGMRPTVVEGGRRGAGRAGAGARGGRRRSPWCCWTP